MNFSPAAVQVLADLGAQGIDVQSLGDALRYRPRSAMTPALLERLQFHKAELLRFLNTESVVAELRQSVERLWKDPAWRSAWERRFQTARYADFAALRRELGRIISAAEGHHRRRDWPAFLATIRYLERVSSGALWDEAAQSPHRICLDLTEEDIQGETFYVGQPKGE